MARVETVSLRTADGERFHLDAPFHVRTLGGIFLPHLEARAVRAPFQHGRTHLGFRIQERIVTLTVDLLGGDPGDRWTRRRELLGILSPHRGALELRVAYDDGTIYFLRDLYYDRDAAADFNTPGSARQDRITVRFIANDPVWYGAGRTAAWVRDDTPRTELVFPTAHDGARIVFHGAGLLTGKHTLTVGGDWPASPTITLTGPLTRPRLVNENTGVEIGLDQDVRSGEVVTITTTPAHRAVESSTRGNLFAVLSAASEITEFTLLPPVLNGGAATTIRAVAVGTSAASAIRMAWYDRWLGL